MMTSTKSLPSPSLRVFHHNSDHPQPSLSAATCGFLSRHGYHILCSIAAAASSSSSSFSSSTSKSSSLQKKAADVELQFSESSDDISNNKKVIVVSTDANVARTIARLVTSQVVMPLNSFCSSSSSSSSSISVSSAPSISSSSSSSSSFSASSTPSISSSSSSSSSFSVSSAPSISSPLLFGNVVEDLLSSGRVDHWMKVAEEVEEKAEELESQLSLLNERLAFRTYLVGGEVTLADLAMWTALERHAIRFSTIPKFSSSMEKYPHVSRWRRHIHFLTKTENDDFFFNDTVKPQMDICDSGGVSSSSSSSSRTISTISSSHCLNGGGGGIGNSCGESAALTGTNFVKQIIESDIQNGVHKNIVMRFPPEPNGFLHLGHAKSICLNFGLARHFGGRCHLRFDDTNPEKEDQRYIDSIQEDVKWLGGDWGGHLYFASDYFDQLCNWAFLLIDKHLAYVDDQTAEEIKASRGNITTPGVNSPFRDRSVETNRNLFIQMKNGEFPEGSRVLRAKIDMSSSNMNMRDPVIYRILNHPHPRTGSKWNVYPMYDFAHGQSDSIEKITHSVCTLEFELHRPLYNWFQEKLEIHRTRQIEFARLNTTYTVMSKRKLLSLVEEGFVKDWDDPRMPTLSGLRRRGYPAAAIKDFCERIGVAKRENVIQFELLENCVREHMHLTAVRRHAILKPLKVIITNFPEGKVEFLDAPNHPEDSTMGTRRIAFSKELYIDEDDFMETPFPKFFRLAPGREVRLRYGYWVKCHECRKDASGTKVVEVHCTYDPSTKGGNPPADGRKVKGTLQWISAIYSHKAEFRMYSSLFTQPFPERAEAEEAEGSESSSTWRNFINRDSLKVVEGLIEEAALSSSVNSSPLQFERVGFFVADVDSRVDRPIFNLTVDLLDSFAAEMKEATAKEEAKLAREKAIAEKKAKKEKARSLTREQQNQNKI